MRLYCYKLTCVRYGVTSDHERCKQCLQWHMHKLRCKDLFLLGLCSKVSICRGHFTSLHANLLLAWGMLSVLCACKSRAEAWVQSPACLNHGPNLSLPERGVHAHVG